MLLSSTKGLYAITDCANYNAAVLIDKTELILKAGIALLQYRNKETDRNDRLELAEQIQRLCRHYSTPFIINDDIEMACELSADGVHLGKEDVDIRYARSLLGDKFIGISCYNEMARAINAQQCGADYVAFGSFFSSPTKPEAVTATVELLKKAKSQLTIPVVAIGGITPENGKTLVDANVDYLAVISGLYASESPMKTVDSFNKLFNGNS